MAASARWQSRLPLFFVISLCGVACTDATESGTRPAPPEVAAPAPPPAVTASEDRGREPANAPQAAAAADGAFTNVEGGEAERAASDRGHQSAGETAPGGK